MLHCFAIVNFASWQGEIMIRRRVLALILAVFGFELSTNDVTNAQTYPTRPITLIVPFAAGGPTDTIARITTEGMRASLGQPIIIENVGGADGSIAVGRAARAAPDGYTLSIGNVATHVLNGAAYSLSYDLLNDFESISRLTDAPAFIDARNSLPAKDLQELIVWLKANPDKASAGVFTTWSRLFGAYFQRSTGTHIQYVPYRGAAPAMQDLVAGQIDLMFDQAGNTLAQWRNGKIKTLAVAAKARLAQAPGIPTMDEAGVPGFYLSVWHGMWAPRGTPKAIIAQLNSAVVAALANPGLQRKMMDLGQEIPPRDQQTPEALTAYQKAEAEKWWPILKAANIKGE
jgi:tripartite-type tricarboxylate transporter receptor subunit TctC